MAAGNNPGQRERRRLTAARLNGKHHRAGTAPHELHTTGPECARIVDDPDGREPASQQQWEAFSAHHRRG